MRKNILEGLDILEKNFLYNPYYTKQQYRNIMKKIEQIILEEENKELVEKKWII